MTEFKLPDIGEGIKDVTITDILVKNQQRIKRNDVAIIVESEKVSLEITIDSDCFIENINVKIGDTISPGDTILTIKNIKDSSTTNVDEKQTLIQKDINKKEVAKKIYSSKEIIDSNQSSNASEEIYASPSIRKSARELNIDLSKIIGSGKNGRITLDDLNEVNSKNSNKIVIEENIKNDTIYKNASKWGLAEKIELNNIKQTTGKRLHDSWTSIPHVTQFDECDITELDKIIKILKAKNNNPNIKVSYIPFFIKVVVKILKKLTIFNSSLNDDKKHLIQKNYFNVGIAINTDKGLVVPVIKGADKKNIKQISLELTQLIIKAKNKGLSLDDMSGGCFTISSLGGISGKFFTPIINPPEVAILGISNIMIKPILINNKFKARKILPISLSYDHRIIDGVNGAKFTKLFASIISNPKQF